MRRIGFLLAFTSVCLAPALALAQDVNGFEARTFTGSTGLTLPYRLFKVKNPSAGAKYPLILFLHGAGERGSDNASQLTANAGATVWATDAHQAAHPAYVVAPQCPENEQWVHTDWTLGSYSIDTVPVSDPLTTALEIAEELETELDTDPSRRYITGLSMGGYGTWDSILRQPDRFAAALPVCGAGDPSKADLIASLPLWTAHGDADGTVPVSGSRDMVMALQALGSDIQYSEYPGVGHDAWTQTYANEDIIDWMFTQHREVPAVGGGAGAGGLAGAAGSGGAGGSNAGGAGGTTTALGGTGGMPATAGASGAMVAGAGGEPLGSAGNATGMPSATSDEDAGCSFGSSSGSRSSGRWLLLAGVAALTLSRRRRARS